MSKKTKKTKEQKDMEEFYTTPMGSFLFGLENFAYFMSELLNSDETKEDDKKEVQSEYNECIENHKLLLSTFENFEKINDYYIDEDKIVIAIFERLDEKSRLSILKQLDTCIDILDEAEFPRDEEKFMGDFLDVLGDTYNNVAPCFVKIEFEVEGGKYKSLLTKMVRSAINSSEGIKKDLQDEEDLEFAYVLKNTALVCRHTMKQVTSDPDSEQFILDFASLLSPKDYEFFIGEILGAFIEEIEMDLDEEEGTIEYPFEYLAMAKKCRYILEKKFGGRKQNENNN